MGQRTWMLWGAAVCLVGAVCTSAAGEQTTPRAVAAKMKNPVAANPASVTSGQQLFQNTAASATATPAPATARWRPRT